MYKIISVPILLLFLWGCTSQSGVDPKNQILTSSGQAEFAYDLESVKRRLEQDVRSLCLPLGKSTSKSQVRNQFNLQALRATEEIIKQRFSEAGLSAQMQEYRCRGVDVRNIEVEILGKTNPKQIVVIGAHYDAHMGPAADDNASGSAGVLELARYFAKNPQASTLRFVTFVNEEPPFFKVKGEMGSEVYAARSRKLGEEITTMISLEMIGYYSSEEGSQKYPPPLNLQYPSVGNFIAFVGTTKNKELVYRCLNTFSKHSDFPGEAAALPAVLPGIDFSDHWSFGQHDYPALMVTDTAFYRNEHYHKESDTPDTLDYNSMAQVVIGLRSVIEDLAGPN